MTFAPTVPATGSRTDKGDDVVPLMSGIVYGAALAMTLVAKTAEASPPAQIGREQFIERCLPRMAARSQKFPDHVCGCLHDNALGAVHDADMRTAVMRNIEETGMPGVNYDSVPFAKRGQIDSTLTELAGPALACLYGETKNAR